MADPEDQRGLPTGTLTFVFTDIEGSTRLVHELGTERFAGVLADHGRIVRHAFDREGGRGVRTEGDSFFYVFERPSAAVAATVAVQRALTGHAFPHQATVRVRMGMHTGEASLAAPHAGTDYVGYDVHRAARIAASGHGGQILVSETTEPMVRDTLPAGAGLRDLGQHRFKDMARPERVYQVVASGLPSDFPRLRSLDLVPNNLPTQVTSFVGRQHEIAEGRRLLDGTRVLTLTGPGGTGKTRLLLQISAHAAAAFPGGVNFVPLAAIVDADLVAPAIVQALGLQEQVQRSFRDRLVEHLRDRQSLLVLDNFEQVLPAAVLVADLISACPRLKIFTSSRSALRISGEQEFPVPPLALPSAGSRPSAESASQYEAVRLFIERAVAVKPDFRVTNENAPEVAEICARLDGLPLAIELAAVRVKLLPPAAILQRLSSRLGLLQSTARDLPDRQKTLRGAISWSYDLLEPAARRLFARLSVFVGGASLEDAERVCGDDVGGDVMDGLAGLIDQSLVRQEDRSGAPRAFMLETIREYALERLDESSDVALVRGRHATLYHDLAQQAAPRLMGVDRRSWIERLESEHDNLRAGFEFYLRSGDDEQAMRLGAALWRFWQMRGHIKEGLHRLGQALAMPRVKEHPVARELALEAAGGLAYWQGDSDAMMRLYQEGLEQAREVGDQARIANGLYNLSFAHLFSKAPDRSGVERAVVLNRQALALGREVGDRAALARYLWGLANVEHVRQHYPESQAALAEAIPIFRELGDHFGLAWALHVEGLVLVKGGRLVEARAALDEQLALLAEARDVGGVALALGDHAELATAEGDWPRAVRLRGASAALRKLCGADLASLADEQLGRKKEFAEADQVAWKEGLAMSFDDAVTFALANRGRAAGV